MAISNTKVKVGRKVSMNVINVTALRDQNKQHYLDAIEKIREENPRVEVHGDRCICYKTISKEISPSGIELVQLRILYFTIIDREGFYNLSKQEKEDAPKDWGDDIVANKKEAVLYFFPNIHKLAVKSSDPVPLNYIQKYLQGAFDYVEPETFSVDIIKSRESIDQIINSEAVYSLKVKITYTNPLGYTNIFQELLDTRMRNSNARNIGMEFQGSENHHINMADDSMAKAALEISRTNGEAEARIKDATTGSKQKVYTYNQPEIIKANPEDPNFIQNLYENINSLA